MPFKSQFPLVDIPDLDLWTFLFERTDRPFPDDKVIFVDAITQRQLTYADIKSTALTFGQGLKSLFDWQKGDVLVLFTPNSIDTPPVTCGTHWAGGVLCPANPLYTVTELAHQLKDSSAKALVTQKAFLKQAREAARLAGLSEERILLLGDERELTGKFKHFTDIRTRKSVMKTEVKPASDLAYMVYSSGTTGLPKGVELSHRNIVASIRQWVGADSKTLTWNGGPDGQGDKGLAFLPFFHIFGLSALIHMPIYLGLTIIVMPRFDLDLFCSSIQSNRITFTYVVPPIVLLLAKHPLISKYDFRSIRMMTSAAAPLSAELVEAVWHRLKIPVRQAYGLSETSPGVYMQPWDTWLSKAGSCGILNPNMEAKFMSIPAEGSSSGSTELRPTGSTTGELWLRGPNVFLRYHNNAYATKDSLTSDGWYRTGDVGYHDPDGYFYTTDRVKELIKYKGFQVAPAELEALLLTNHMVADCAVVGVEDQSIGSEVPRAYIVGVGKTGFGGKEEEGRKIVDWVAERVSNHKRLRGGVRFVESIPKSATGKILRRVLREEARRERGKARL